MVAVSLNEVLEVMQKRSSPELHIAVAVDGSAISDKACMVAASFTNVKRGDKLSVLHISDNTKTHLPKNLEPRFLRTHYEDLASSSRVQMEWVCREKDEGQTTCQVVTKLATKRATDLLVLGSFGRKGEKLDMLGTVSDYSLRESHASICIVRGTGHAFAKQAKFLFATDGSHAAAVAFCMLVTMLKRSMDTVDVVLVTTTDGTAEQQTVDHYREFMEQHKVVGQAHVKCIDRTVMTVPEGVIDAVKELNSDVLVLGISGYGKKKLGSVSEQISVTASCTTIIIKDKFDIVSNRYSTGAKSLATDFLPQKYQSRPSGKSFDYDAHPVRTVIQPN